MQQTDCSDDTDEAVWVMVGGRKVKLDLKNKLLSHNFFTVVTGKNGVLKANFQFH